MYENIVINKMMPWSDHPIKQQRWHPMRTAMLMRLGPVMPRRKLAKILGVAESTLRQKATQMGVALYSCYEFYSEQELQFMEQNRHSLSFSQIADHLGRSLEAVKFAMKSRGWNTGRRYGERHQFSRYTDSDVELCRALRDTGMRFKTIAEKMDVPVGTVKSWVYFESRKILTEAQL